MGINGIHDAQYSHKIKFALRIVKMTKTGQTAAGVQLKMV